jgi:hypothetical protein
MDSNKSLDESEIIAAYLHDVQKTHGDVFNIRAMNLTVKKVKNRVQKEGLGFLTKTLPRLGKALDKALTQVADLNCIECGFKPIPGTKLPKLMGEFFKLVLDPNGSILPSPCESSVRVIRQFCLLFYKYELPYTDEQEHEVSARFLKTEQDIEQTEQILERVSEAVNRSCSSRRNAHKLGKTPTEIVREARILLSNVFAFFDPMDIYPRHGPGAVATKQQLWGKYQWTNVSARITEKYSLDAFFFASLGHVCDRLEDLKGLPAKDLPARVVLVPKDSRGPRLISCEPVDFQWIQQGLGTAIVRHVEKHPLTRENVRFTDQEPNRNAALLGSIDGKYSTLDLNEASDRVSLDLVRLLFPEHVFECLAACRSTSTVMPDGLIVPLRKFAPMGSCLCFPVLALCVWAILTAGSPDGYTRERVYVYGDDVIVPTAQAADAIEQLESFGLKVNRDKSCTSGLFRESCGMDAFKGKDVTPIRIRTVWSSTPSPSSYSSWIAYANSFWDRRCFNTYDKIVGCLRQVYGRIPGKDMHLACPSLNEVLEPDRPLRARTNKNLQKREYWVWDLRAPSKTKQIDGWSMLLRYFTEYVGRPVPFVDGNSEIGVPSFDEHHRSFSTSKYTSPRSSELVRGWR